VADGLHERVEEVPGVVEKQACKDDEQAECKGDAGNGLDAVLETDGGIQRLWRERNAPYNDDLVVDGHVDIAVESVEPIDDEIDAQTERGEHPESSARDGERVNEVAEGALGR